MRGCGTKIQGAAVPCEAYVSNGSARYKTTSALTVHQPKIDITRVWLHFRL